MKTPQSFRVAFRAQRSIGKELEKNVGGQLRRVCKDEGWLFDGRVKSYEGALAKLQQGTLAAFSDLGDLYAATVVVPARDELQDAVDAVRAKFQDAELKPAEEASLRTARTFKYDDIHMHATLGSTAPGVSDAIRGRVFEIQVRTGLQFSWWRATHDQIYKGPVSSWRLERTANQVRGSIELLDGVLADLPRAAKMLDERETERDSEFALVTGWLARWPEDRRPEDRRRFFLTVDAWLQQAGIPLEEFEPQLDTDRGRELIAEEDVTPAQVVQALAAEDKGAAALVGGELRLLRTDELAAASQELSGVDPARCVALD